MYPVRPVTDADIDTLDTGMPSEPIGDGESAGDDTLVVASAAAGAAGGTMLESVRAARSHGRSELDGLYLELARRSRAAEVSPDNLSAPSLPQLESFNNEESLQSAIDYGKAVFERFEHSVHDLLCGDSPRDMDDRRKVVARLNGAVNNRMLDLQNILAGILLAKLFLIPPLHMIVAQIVIEKFMKPILGDAGQVAAPYVTCVCQTWTSRLNDDDKPTEIA